MGGIPDFKCPGWLNGGQKSKPQKTPRASNKTQKNLWSKINPQNIACQISKPWKKSQNKFGCTLFVELCLWEYGGATTNLQIVLNTPKNPYLNQATPKKYFTNFPNPKNPRIEDLKPKKVLRSSPPLEIRSTPPPTPWKCSKGRVRAILRCLWHPLKLTKTSFLLTISNHNRSSWPQSSEKVMRVNKLIT